MSKWDRVNVAELAGCCVGVIQRRAGLGAEGDVMCCPCCPAVLVFAGGAWGAYAGFAARFGVLPWDRHMGRRYPRGGRCELCGRGAAEVAADYAARYPAGDDRNAHLRVLMFDHCHAHSVTRGLLCLGCNNDMALFDKGLPAGHVLATPRRVAYARNCPQCCYAATLLAAIQHSQGK